MAQGEGTYKLLYADIYPMKDVKERIEALSVKEPNSGCWLWEGSVHGKGYGHIWYNGSNRKAHRVSYEVYTGEIPSGMVVMHKCDNPSCVNPSHLSLGTNQDNMDDRNNKGRQARGETSGNAKLKADDVIFIRENFGKYTKHELVKMFGVTYPTICNVLAKRIWAHIEETIKPLKPSQESAL